MRLAVNGLGRIGRALLRQLHADDFPHGKVLLPVAVNDPAPAEQLALLLQHDSLYGAADMTVELKAPQLRLNDRELYLTAFSEAADLPWREMEVDLVMECSGTVLDRKALQAHLKAGASRVLLSRPDSGDLDATVVFGVNQGALSGGETLVSAASCTSNCLVPLLAVLDQAFGIQQGSSTTLHAPMNDQPLLDSVGAADRDLRLLRAGGRCLTPVRTRLAEGVGRILPQLAGRFISHSVRLPGAAVSAMDLTVQLKKPATVQQINDRLREAAKGELHGILGVCEQPLVSEDFLGNLCSATVDFAETAATDDGLVRLLAWFDNEMAYARRMLDLAAHWSSLR